MAYSASDSATEIEVGAGPIAPKGAVVAVIQAGEGEGATGEQAGMRKPAEAQVGSAASEAFTLGIELTGGPE